MSDGDKIQFAGLVLTAVIALAGACFGAAWWLVTSINRLGTRLEVGDEKFRANDEKHVVNEREHAEFYTRLHDHHGRLIVLETQGSNVPRNAA